MVADLSIILNFASVFLYFSCIRIQWLRCYCVSIFFVIFYGIIDDYAGINVVMSFFVVPEEVKLLEREYFNRWYSLKAYYMVTLVTTLPNLVWKEIPI